MPHIEQSRAEQTVDAIIYSAKNFTETGHEYQQSLFPEIMRDLKRFNSDEIRDILEQVQQELSAYPETSKLVIDLIVATEPLIILKDLQSEVSAWAYQLEKIKWHKEYYQQQNFPSEEELLAKIPELVYRLKQYSLEKLVEHFIVDLLYMNHSQIVTLHSGKKKEIYLNNYNQLLLLLIPAAAEIQKHMSPEDIFIAYLNIREATFKQTYGDEILSRDLQLLFPNFDQLMSEKLSQVENLVTEYMNAENKYPIQLALAEFHPFILKHFMNTFKSKIDIQKSELRKNEQALLFLANLTTWKRGNR